MDRGFDPDAADPFRGLTAHAEDGDAPVDRRGVRANNQPSDEDSAARTRPWSWGAVRALFAAWVAIASSYRSEGPMVEAENDTYSRSGE